GKNNAGKTSLLEALAMNFSGLPHRSMETVPAPNVNPPELSNAQITILLGRDEVHNLLRALGHPVYLPYPADGFTFPGRGAPFNPNDVRLFIDWFLPHPKFTISVRRRFPNRGNQEHWPTVQPAAGIYEAAAENQPGRRNFVQFQFGGDGGLGGIGTANAEVG